MPATRATRAVRTGRRRSLPRWLDTGMNAAEARFLMLTAITHHWFGSPAWGESEVRKLHAELAELDRLASQAVYDNTIGKTARRLRGPLFS